LPKIKHKIKKESLQDVFSFEEIEEWLERISKDLP
jgi:NAD-dependent DNA ligase